MKDQIMLKLSYSIAVLLIGITTATAATFPPADKWEFLGTKNIGHHLDKDVVYVRSSKELYTEIEVRTDRPNVNLHKCVIHFLDGDKQKVKLDKDRWGGETHIIELYGGARRIDKIEIWGSRDYGKVFRIFDKGTVEFWGRKAKRRKSNRFNSYNWNNNDNDDRNYYRELERDRERARRAQEEAKRDRERARRDRERARRDRERNRDRRNSSVCPPRRGGW